jgi:hypothetical protein
VSEQPNEVQQAAGESVRTAITVAMQAAELRAALRSQRALEAQAASDQARAAAADRLRAERDAAMPILRRPWDQRWWREVGVEELAQAWQVCAEWAAADDAYARATLEELRRQVSRRYGVALPPGPTSVAELAMLLAAPGADVGPEPEFAELEPEVGPRFGYTVRAADGQEVAVGEIAAASLEDAALEALGRYARSSPDAGQDPDALIDRLLAQGFGVELPGPDMAGVVVDVVAVDGDQRLSVPADQADRLRTELRRVRQEVIGGGEEVSDVDRLAAIDAEVRAGRIDAAGLRRRLEDARRVEALGGESKTAEAQSELRAVNGRLGDLALRRRVVEAEARGEDGAAVRRAAVLRENLDEEWWRTASIGEIAGVVDEVSTWGPGTGRDGAQRWLRVEIHRSHHVDVKDLSDAGEVAGVLAAALGRADPDGPELRRRPAPSRAAELDEHAASAVQNERAAAALAATGDRETAEAISAAAEGFDGTPTVRLNATIGRRSTERKRRRIRSRGLGKNERDL